MPGRNRSRGLCNCPATPGCATPGSPGPSSILFKPFFTQTDINLTSNKCCLRALFSVNDCVTPLPKDVWYCHEALLEQSIPNRLLETHDMQQETRHLPAKAHPSNRWTRLPPSSQPKGSERDWGWALGLISQKQLQPGSSGDPNITTRLKDSANHSMAERGQGLGQPRIMAACCSSY